MKVELLSVVGAFRTGKSFLLNLFLRYLRRNDSSDSDDDWILSSGKMCFRNGKIFVIEAFSTGSSILDGNMNDWVMVSHTDKDGPAAGTIPSKPGFERQESFSWRAGPERQTTGVWMWSEPFIRKREGRDDVALLLMDTQGMFDNETTMTITAQIFGLSTLVSSYQVKLLLYVDIFIFKYVASTVIYLSFLRYIIEAQVDVTDTFVLVRRRCGYHSHVIAFS